MRSLFLRIFLSFWLVMVLIGTAFALIQLSTTDWAPRRKIGMITRALRSHGTEALARQRDEGPAATRRFHDALERELGVRIYLLGDLAPLPGSRIPTPEAKALAARATRQGRIQRDASPRRDLYAVPLGPGVGPEAGPGAGGHVIVGELPHPERLRRYLQPETLPLRLLVLFLVAGLVSYALARYLSRPILGLRRATQRLAEGDLSARVDPPLVRRRDETGALGRDFDRMASRLQALLTAQKRLLWDISHELRSPLARLNVALGLARQKIPPEATAVLDRIEKEAERLNDLVGQLTTLNLLESGAEPIESQPIDLGELVDDIVQDSRFEGQAREVGVVLETTAPVTLHGSRELLRRAIENVLRNAIHATHSGTDVTMTLTREEPTAAAVEAAIAGPPGNWACITVRDQGPGVPAEALQDIFRPFYRVAEARERRTGGSGLGLSISQRSVHLHGGSIAAKNIDGGGLQVEIRLPLAPTP